MGSLSLWGSSFHLAQVFALLSAGILHPVTDNSGLGAAFRRARGGERHVLLLPAIAVDQFLARNCLRLVLSFDGVFCPLAGFPHGSGGLLAALDIPGR